MPTILLLTLPANFISKEIEKHDGMPANFLERKTWRNASQFSYSACTFHFDSHWKTWRSARQFFRTFFLFVGISFPGASRAALEDQVGSQVDLLMVLRTPFRKWTSPLCENPHYLLCFWSSVLREPHYLLCFKLSRGRLLASLWSLWAPLGPPFSDFSE